MTAANVISFVLVAFFFGLLVGYRLQKPPKRAPVLRFSDGREVSSLYFFEWLAITDLDKWPPMSDVLTASRMVGAGFTAPEIERIVTAVRPMAQRALQRGERALRN